MTFISYAQNFEDVMLWRALRHIKNGFYVDVGAAWPDKHSVTKAFYLEKWSGVNIEPNPAHHVELELKRKRDTNLDCAVGNEAGTTDFYYIVGNSGLSTVDVEVAREHEKSGWKVIKNKVSISTLASILEKNTNLKQDIHFLKVDVEGAEDAVLQSNDWNVYRPWIILVEATKPMSPEPSYDKWEYILTDNSYNLAYDDGLNRYYVSEEHLDLLSAFSTPPNVFDEFVTISHKQAADAEHQLAAQVKALGVQFEELNLHSIKLAQENSSLTSLSQQLQVKLTVAQSKLDYIVSTASWRITAPLRYVMYQMKAVKKEGLRIRTKAGIRKLSKSFLSRGFKFYHSNSSLHGCLRTLAFKMGLYDQLSAIYSRIKTHSDSQSEKASVSVIGFLGRQKMTKHAESIHKRLMTSFEKVRA